MFGIDLSETKSQALLVFAVLYLCLGSGTLILWLYARHLLKDRRKGKTSSGQWWLNSLHRSPLYNEDAEDVDILKFQLMLLGGCVLMFLAGSAVCWALLLWWD